MKLIGIDPGEKGGVAWLVRGEVETMSATTTTDTDLLEAIRESLTKQTFCYLEDCRGILPGRRLPKAISKPAESFGFFRGALLALKVPFEIVAPKVWQKPFKLPSLASVGSTQKKRVHKQRASELFPTVDVIHATADAILIAEYGRRLRAGELTKR